MACGIFRLMCNYGVKMSIVMAITIPSVTLASSCIPNSETGEFRQMNNLPETNADFFKALSVTLKVISEENSLENLIKEEHVFFDKAEPFYPKTGPLNTYILSRCNELQVNFERTVDKKKWNVAYISPGSKVFSSGMNVYFSVDELKDIGVVFVNESQRVQKLKRRDGVEELLEFKEVNFSYKNKVSVSFTLKNNAEDFSSDRPFEFIKIELHSLE